MIGTLHGQVSYVGSEFCIIATAGGVGYRVFMPADQLSKLKRGETTDLLIHTSVREDAIQLYGFMDQSTYELFILLLGVSGIGPKGAGAILSSIQPESFYVAIQTRDLKVLKQLPGVGKKTAERLILELKDKVGDYDTGNTVSAELKITDTGEGDAVAEAVAALCALGYTNSEIMPLMQKVPDYRKLGSEELIRKTLQIIAKNM